VKHFAWAVALAFGLQATAARAQSFELDTLLPDDIPGYGAPFAFADSDPADALGDPAGLKIGGLAVRPALALAGGFDSGPQGTARGSALLQAAPSVAVTDAAIGFAGFAGGTVTAEPQAPVGNAADGEIGAGEEAVLPGETITLGGAFVKAQETGFDLATVVPAQKVDFSLVDLRAGDAITLGRFSLAPALGLTDDRFAGVAAAENRTEARESLTAGFSPDGQGRIVLRWGAAQQQSADAALDARNWEMLAGVEDTAADLWRVRLLAGAAWRQPAHGVGLTAPVLEAALDWLPFETDQVRLRLAHELDDPDAIAAAPYTLTAAELSLRHEGPGDGTVRLSGEVSRADYIGAPLRETLVGLDATLDWPLNRALGLRFDYAFNDRQANFLRAANEQVITAAIRWTP
jgi:hypothetical protein